MNSVVRLTALPDMTIAVYCGRKATFDTNSNVNIQFMVNH